MAQSVKIPVELELRQLQGSIQTLKKALDKVKPGTKAYESLSKSLDKIEHQFYSLENASKKSFKNIGEVNSFEKAFEKVANSISDVASDFKRLNFGDLTSDLFSKEDIQRIQEASNNIKKVQTDIDNLRSNKFKEVASSSDEIKKAFSDLEIDLDTTNIDEAIKNIKNNLKSLSSQIGGKTRSINTKKNQLNLLETQAAAISSLQTGEGLTLAQKFGANFFDSTGNAFKDEGSKKALVEMLAGLGLSKANLVKVQQSTAEDLNNFSDEIIKSLQATAAQMQAKIKEITQTELPTLTLERDQLISSKENQNAALKQLSAIDPSLITELNNYKQQLEEAKEQLVLLKQELAQARVGQEAFDKVSQDSADSVKSLAKSCDEGKDSLENFNRAQEKLNDIKFAIKNWFGFNEVINLTKNAVRNMITQIRELDDVMTQIAIVTDMTQQELWTQMDTYSAMAQQYGASIKGVYEVSQLYYQQGLQTAEVMNLTEETLKMAKIANLDYAEATDYMTVALRGFKLEMSDAQQVTDVYSALAAATASDTEELAVAMSKTASSAEAVGSSFESTSAMIATMISITREAPENIGSALKSIISRYGEMTSDPMKLVDSEGEEMSLNKVDKALQSVGISLQNAQGQFRDFDDVILELSKSWDTIDTNTQRYIATVMAGNRQQSRFLALVGNYEEYAKALEVAENAEDAGTLQTLKTMDSISTKWEQLKVSLQEFYTSAGLEDVFKGVLDALTAFLTKANDIPKLFGKIPVSVIALASSLITSIKNVATSLTSSLMGPISDFNKKLDELAKKNIEIKVKAVPETGSGTQARQVLENEAQQGGPITTNKNPLFTKDEYSAIDNYFKKGDEKSLQKLKEITGLDDNDIKQLKQELDGLSEAERKALGLSDDFAKKLSDTPSLFDKVKNSIGKLQNSSLGKFFSKNAGSISLVTSALSAYALTIKDAASATVESSKTISGGLNTIGGLALGIFGGQWQYAIPMLISGIPTLIDGLIYTTEEKLKNATEKATELSNISLQKKSDYKNLKNETKELENLTEARHDSAEAYQEWLDYNNQMASSYPELISYIDSEGNAIIDLAASYESLESARIAAAQAATDAVNAQIIQKELGVTNADNQISQALGFEINFTPQEAEAAEQAEKLADLQTQILTSGNINSDIINAWLANAYGNNGIKELQNLESLNSRIHDDSSKFNSEYDLFNFLTKAKTGYSLEELEYNPETETRDFSTLIGTLIGVAEEQEKTIIDDFQAELQKVKDSPGEESNKALMEFVENNYTELLNAQNELTKIAEEDNSAKANVDALQQVFNYYKEYKKALTQQALANKQLEASYRQGISTFAYYDNEISSAEVGEELTNFNELVTDFMVRRWKQSGKDIQDYLQSQESLDYQEFEGAFEKIWQPLSSSQQAALNELLASREDYDFGDYKEALADFGITQGVIYDELTTQWYEEYGQAYLNFVEAFSNRQEKDQTYLSKGLSKLQNIAPKYYDEILDFYDKVNLQISDGLISQLQGSGILDAYSSLWQQSKGLENEAEIQKILTEGDFTSLAGIYEVRDALEKAGMDANDILIKLADTIHVNLTTEWDSYFSTITTKIGELEESLNKAAEGMSLEEAQSLTEKLEGVTLSDFDIKDGEFIFKNVEQINQYYTSYFDDLKNDLTSKTEDLESVKNALEIGTATVTKNGVDYTQDDLPAITEALEKANDASTILDDYKNQLIGNTLIQLGQISQFLDHLGLSGEIRNTAKNAILTGDTDKIAQLFPDYSKALIDTFQNITKDTYSSVIDSITSGEVIEITEANRAILESFGNGVKIINDKFASVSTENIDSIIATISSSNLKLTDKNELLQSIYDSQEKFDKNQAFAEVIGNLDSISSDAVTALANSLGLTFNIVSNWFSENADGTFTTSLSNIVSKFNEFGDGFSAEVQDAINEYFNNILGIVSNGISGSMTNVEFETLSSFMGLDLDFTETSEGLKLTKASAIEVYTELKKIDSIQAQITFSDLAESLEEAGSGYEDVASTMKTIAELNRELADVPVSSERRDELERELAVAEEILRVRSQDPDSFNFMDKDLPTGMQGPENYWNSVGQAYKVMNESAKSGYMEIQDYVNLVNQMEAMAIAAGQEFSIGGMNAAQLIEKGMSSLKNIDGEGVKIAMEGVGIDFANAATDMGLSFDDGIKEVAKSQIKMLDAAIRMLEAMVAMENIDANSDGFLELGEIFVDPLNSLSDGIQESDWQQSVIDWADDLEDAAGKISIGGKSLLDALATLSPKQVQNALNQLMSIDWTLGDTDIASQIQNVLSAYFPDVDITQGKSVFDILEVPDDADKNAEHFTKWLDDMNLSLMQYNALMGYIDENTQTVKPGRSLFDSITNMLGIDKEKNKELYNSFSQFTTDMYSKGFGIQDVIKAWDEITIEKDGDSSKYTYNNTAYDSLDNALKAMELSDKTGEKVDGVHQIEGVGSIQTEGTINVGNSTFKIQETRTGAILYVDSKNIAHNTLREAIEAEVSYKTSEGGVGTVEAYAQYGVDITAEGLANVSVEGIKEVLSSDIISQKIQDAGGTGDIVIPIDGKNVTFAAGTSETEIQQKLMEAIGIDAAQMETIVTAISTAISTANWSPVGEAIATALKTNIGQGENGAEAIEIGELTLKPTDLIIDNTNIIPKLSSEEGLTNIPVGPVTILPEKIEVSGTPTLAQNEDGTVDLQDIGTAKATASQVDVEVKNNNFIPEVGQTVTLTYEAAGTGTVASIEITNNGDYVDTNQNPILQNYTGTVTGTADNATVSVATYDIKFTDQEGNAATLQVQGKANLEAIIDGLTNSEGFWKLNNVTGEVSVTLEESSKNALITFFDELVEKLQNMEVSYEEPTPVGSTGEGKYSTTYPNNFTGTPTEIKGSSIESIVNALNSAIQTGMANPDNFTITQLNADGSTITAATTTVTAEGGVTLNGVKSDGNDNNNSGGQSGGGTTPVPEAPTLDTSNITEALQEIEGASSAASSQAATAAGSLEEIDASPATEAQGKISGLAEKIRNIPSNGASKINAVANAIKNLKSKTITATVNVSVKVSKPSEATGNISISNGSGRGYTTGSSLSMSTKLANAKGNVALAKGNVSGKALASGSRKTLMGELGPELVVSNGSYFLVGQNGAEFVDLANDAIVFNHLQTQSLLKNGHGGTGKPVTNERKATSLATGNVSGPAMASASEALAQLRQIRAMWQAMLDASAKDLGSKAGSGGGGGGGGGGGEDIKAVTGELERWYNLLRQIDSLEQHITLEQAKRANMLSGYSHVDSLEKELEMLKEQQAAYGKLAKLQKDYYDRRREDLLSTDYSKIFTYTEHGLMQYVDGENRGLDVLAKLNERDATGKLINNAVNAKAQIKYLQNIGFDTSILKNNEDGTKAKNEEEMMENFWAGVDGWMEELDGLYDSYHDATINFEESTEKMNEILQEYIDNQLSVEQKLMQAIQDREQAEIDRIQDEKDALEEAAQSYIDGLSEALSKEQDMYSKNETNAETQKLQRQLAILQRSGGSTSEIKSLQDQIDSRLKDAYFQEQQDQIDAIQQASDNQLEKLQNQIDIMTESLEYQKEHGLLWNEVYEMMNQWTPEQMLQFIEEYTKSYQENSALQNEEDSKETLKELEIYTGKRDLDKREAGWAEYYANAKYDEELKKQHSEAAKKAYDEAFASGGSSAGEAAANKVYDDAIKKKEEEDAAKKKAEEDAAAKKEQEPIKVTQNGSLSGGQMNVRTSASAKSKSKGVVKSGKTFTAVGYKNGWLKVENAKSTNGTVSGYMKYTNYKQYYRGIDITKLPSYSAGGDIDFTGLAMVHGSKNNPENILSAEHTKLLRQGIFSNSNHSLAATVEAIQELARNMASSAGANETGINIEQLSVNIQPGVISSDYDARRAGEMALEEMVKIARKTTNRVISR